MHASCGWQSLCLCRKLYEIVSGASLCEHWKGIAETIITGIRGASKGLLPVTMGYLEDALLK